MIEPRIILDSFLIFIAAFFAHVMYWRFFKPKQHMAPLFIVFVLVPLLFLVSLLSLQVINGGYFILVSILYISIAAAYIQTYPAIQAKSPSLYIVYLIGKSTQGLTQKAISEKMGRDDLIDCKLDELKFDKLLNVSEKGVLELTAKGRVLAVLFATYRGLLGLKQGQG